jgi:glycosyltransferase involved in cell wall biosynthesis
MPETPFFSIIIPTFNRADKLDIPIKSILNQEFKNWELIIIDDGSIDKTKELVASFNQNNIHYFHQNNRGKSAARNLGITKAIGKYISVFKTAMMNTYRIIYKFYMIILVKMNKK